MAGIARAAAIAIAIAALGLAAAGADARPASGAHLDPGPASALPAPPPPQFSHTGCTAGQTNQIDAQAGIDGEPHEQFPCLPGQPGGAGDLTGFAFVLRGCLTGGIGEIALHFRVAEIGDPFYLFIWRDLGGLPSDACGLAAYGAYHNIQVEGGLWSIYDLCSEMIPIADGERIHVGVVYRFLSNVFGPDWYIGRSSAPGFPDHAYVNLSGAQGDWVDLAAQGYANRWGVSMTNLTGCGPADITTSTWGAIKAMWQ